MKKVLALAIITLSVSFTAFAQDKAADLKKLFELMDSKKMIDGMMDNMIPALKKQASQQIQGKDAKKKFDKYIEFIMKEVKDLSNKLVNEEMVAIYDKHYTHQEIKDLIAFYSSATGKKMLEITPAITKDLMEAMMSKYMPEFQERLEKKLKEFED